MAEVAAASQRPGGRPKRRFRDVELDGSRKEDLEDSGRWRRLIGGKGQKEKISRRAPVQG